MQNIGEEITGEYLRVIKNCDFVQYNAHGNKKLDEIDVIGLNLKGKTVYICEVAAHILGLLYPKGSTPDTKNRLIKKFSKDIAYADKHFAEYKKVFMFWSPIVKKSNEKAKYCAQRHVKEAADYIKERYDIEIEVISNQNYANCLQELREYASKNSSDLKNSAVLRFLQIEEFLGKHLQRINKLG